MRSWRLGLFGGPTQVQLEAHPGVGAFVGRAQGRQAGHDVDARTAQGHGAHQRLAHHVLKLGLAPGQAGQPAIAVGPVAGFGVEQHQLQVQVAQARLDLGSGVFVRNRALDPCEAIARGGGKAVEKRQLGVQPRQVGGKFEGRHGCEA